MKSNHASPRLRNAYLGQLPRTNDGRKPKPDKRWEGGVEINTGASPILDVRFLCAAIKYPYMFNRKHASLQIERQWSAAFTLTCMEVDAFLGEDKRGFQWMQLDIANGRPRWHWSLGTSNDQLGAVADSESHAHTEHGKARSASNSELFHAIQSIVDNGMRRATLFNLDASNSGDMQ
jgi:hypothetical protein